MAPRPLKDIRLWLVASCFVLLVVMGALGAGVVLLWAAFFAPTPVNAEAAAALERFHHQSLLCYRRNYEGPDSLRQRRSCRDCEEEYRVFHEYFGEDPEYFNVLYFRAGFLEQHGQLDEALRDYDASIRLRKSWGGKYLYRHDSDSPGPICWTLESRAELLEAMGRHAEALDAYEAALAATPDHLMDLTESDLRMGIGRMQEALGRHDEARRSFEKAKQVEPEPAPLVVERLKDLGYGGE